MAPPRSKSQNTIFYTGKWTREIESIVLGKMDLEKWRGNWVYGDHKTYETCVRKMRVQMYSEHGLNLSLNEYNRKLTEWEGRYRQFSWLISRGNVTYDEDTNLVDASGETWKLIKLMRPDALVYKAEGELNWGYLKELFQVVVEISDTQTGTEGDEVTTPSHRYSAASSEDSNHPSAATSSGGSEVAWKPIFPASSRTTNTSRSEEI